MPLLLALACTPKPAAALAPAVYQVAVEALEDPLFVPEDPVPWHVFIDVIHRVNPIYPPGAELSGERCMGRIKIDFDGAPSEVTVTECTEVFAAATRTALQQWRWTPLQYEGEPVRGETSVVVTYRLADPVE